MPTLYTHYEFGQTVLNNLNGDVQKEIKENINYYNMFNQGFDNIYYYLFRWIHYRKFGIYAHKHNIDLFFKNIILFIQNNNLENDSKLTTMFYGFLNHYTLDTLMHPLINYQVSNLKIPHTKLEYMLDYEYYQELNSEKWNGKLYRTLIPKVKFDKNLLNLINYSFFHTYQEKNIGLIFKRSHSFGYYIHRYFIYDKWGLKSKFYQIIDLFSKKNAFKFSQNTFYIKKFDQRILNEDKNEWNRGKEKYNYSMPEIYEYSLQICINLNNLAYEIIHNQKDIEPLLEKIRKISLKNMPLLLEK